MSSVQGGGVVVTNSGVGGEEEGIGEVNAAVVVADDKFTFSINGFEGFVIEEFVELGVEDKFANEPAAIGCEGFEVGVVAGEKLLVIDVVAILGHAKFVLQLRGVVFFKFAGNPRDQFRPLIPGGLVFFRRRHFFKVKLLLHLVEEIEACVESQIGKGIQANISLAGAVFVAVDTIILDQVGCLRCQRELVRRKQAGSANEETEVKREDVFSLRKDHELEQR